MSCLSNVFLHNLSNYPMRNEVELWQFIELRLRRGERVTLLVVAESSGSSPGRAGYKMAVGMDGELIGSIGGGVMEVNLVELAMRQLSETRDDDRPVPQMIVQEHRRNAEHPSGMICSGEQTVFAVYLEPSDLRWIRHMPRYLRGRSLRYLTITSEGICVRARKKYHFSPSFFVGEDGGGFTYEELLTSRRELFIIGGGHCSLALSEQMAKLGFHITILDDRPGLNTIAKNEFADQVSILDSYEFIEDQLPAYDGIYVVIMTIGYASDKVAIRQLLERDFTYVGVLGSKAKTATLMRELKAEGCNADRLARIRMPIGLPINSHTPEEIAVSVAAEIIAVKNA